MKTYKLYYSAESNSLDVYEIKKFLKRNKISNVTFYPYIKGSDAVAQISHLNVFFDRQLAEQSITLSTKLRYVLLIVEDSENVYNIEFYKGKDDILTYLQTNLL